jgi:hypothetical protein
VPPGCADVWEIADFAVQEIPFLAQHSELGRATSKCFGTGKVNWRLYFVQFSPGGTAGVLVRTTIPERQIQFAIKATF